MSKYIFFPNWISDRVSVSVKGGLACIILGVVFLFFASSAFGQATRTWQGSDGGDWNDAANWSGGFVPQPGDNVIIDSDQSAPITGHPAISLLSLTVSGNVILENNAAPGTNDLITVTGTFSVAAGKTLTLGIPGTGGTDFTLATTATGTLDGTIFLNSNATSTPIITVNGNLAIAANGLISGQAGSRFTLSTGATLQIANTAGITGTGGTTGAVLVGGIRTYQDEANYVYNGTSAQNTGNGLTQNSPANLTISNTAGVTLTSSKTIRGTLTVNAGSVFTIASGQSISTGNIIMVTGSAPTSITGAGTLNVNANLAVSDDGGGSSGATISSPVSFSNNTTRVITVANGSADVDLTISGVISGPGSLDKRGPGTMVLSAANDYTGFTTINAGILRAGVNNALSTGGLTVQGGTYDIGPYSDTIGGVTLLSGSIVGSTGILTATGYNVQSGTISANLTGANGLNKNSAGTVTLSGVNTYSATTNINQGILRLGSNGALSNSPVTLNGGSLSTGETIGFSGTAGNFRVTANSTIALGTGSHELRFSNPGTWTDERTLTITGWTGTAGTSGTSGKIFVGSTSTAMGATRLAQITFSGYAPGAVQLSTGEIVPAPPYQAQIISANLGPSTWCTGDSREITVTIKNTGVVAWTDGAGVTPRIRIGVKWNTNGASWNEYYVTVPSKNLAPGETDTYDFELVASDFTNDGYGNPLATGSNNISFDVIYEGIGAFSSNANGLGPGNIPFTSPAITILPTPTADPGPSLSDICQGATSAAMGGSVSGGATGGIWSGGAGTWTNPTNPATATYTAAASESGIITLTLTTTGGSCGSTSVTKEITINENPTVDAGSSLSTICHGEESTFLGGTFGGAATSAIWTSNGSGTFTNNTGTTPETATYIPGAADSGTITLTLTTTGGVCGPATASKTITVNPNPIAEAGPALSDICQGATSTAMGGSVSGGATGGIWSGGAGTWTNPTNPATATYTAAASESGIITLILTTTGGSCGSITVTKEITINENPTVDAGSSLSAICQGEESAFLGGTFGGAATSAIWTSNGSGTFTNNTGSTPETATYIAGVADSGTITLTLTTSGGVCGPVTASKTITVNPNPIAEAGPALSDICQGETSTVMGGSVSGGATGGIWSGGAGTWTNPTNPATATYTAAASESGIITLTLTTTGGSCGSTTAYKTITVNQNPTVSTPTTPIVLCQGQTSPPMGGSFGGGATGAIWSGGQGEWINPTDPANATYKAGPSESGTIILTLTSTGGSCETTYRTRTITVNPTPILTSPVASIRCSNETVTYTADSSLPATTFQWTRAAVEGISNATATGSGASITENLINTTTNPIDVTYTITLTANGCSSTQSVVVTVNSETVIVENPDPEGDDTCSGDEFADISVVATGTNLSYQWYRNTEPDTVSGTAIVGETSPVYSPSFIPLGSHYYYVKVSGACGTLVSELSGRYDVFPSTTQIDIQPSSAPQSVCKDEPFSPIEALASGNVTYQWFRNTVNSNIGGTLLPGETDLTITPPSDVVGTFYYYAIATSEACGKATSNVSGAFTVRPKPEISDMVTTVCSDGPITVTPANGTNGVVPTGTSYTWGAPTVEPGISGGTGGDGNSISGSLTNSTSVPLSATYTVTPLTGTCPGEDFTVTVTVYPTPTLSTTLTPPAICSNSAFTYSPNSETSNVTFTWTRAAVPGISNAPVNTAQTTNPNEILINTTANPVEVTYTYTLTANGCSNTQDVTVTVNPTPSLSSTLTPPAICTNTPFTYSPTSATSNAEFTWTRAAVDGISNTAVTEPQGTDPNEILINTTANPIDVVYAYTITANGCNNTQNVTVRVNPTPALSSTLTPPAICTNSAFTYTPTSETGGAAFTWTRSIVDGISNAAGSGSGPVNETLVNTTVNPVDVVYIYTISANGCSNTEEVTVTVNPTLTLSSSLTPPAVCSNSAFTYTPQSLSVDVEYRWTRAAVSGISNPAIIEPQEANPNEILINTTALPVNVVYTYTLTANGCSNTQNVTVRVNPTPTIPDTTVTICSGQTFSVSPSNGGASIVPPGTTYTWEVANNPNNIPEDAVQRIPQNSISQTLTNSTTAVQTVIYTVFPVSGGCAGTPFTVTVNVNPVPTVTTPNQGVCNGGITAPITFTGNGVAGKTYTWTNDNPSIGLPASGTGDIPAFTVVNTGNTNKVANITVTPYANGCPGPQHTFTITASPTPTITLGADYCAVPGYVQLQAGSNIDGTTYTWNTTPVQTGPIANVDLAGTFIVTATTPDGCQKTASISVAQELVVNGSFTAGNTGFFSGNNYVYLPYGPPQMFDLEDEGTYAVGTNARDYHRYFWGIDHTNNTVGPRNMLMVNTSDPKITVWQQTVNVEEYTQYYFSAWGMTINAALPYAKLRFEVNGVQVGTTANLPAGPQHENHVIANTYWERFYGIWNSDSISGPITIRIVNLESSLDGNDFALDDISFGTLSTFLILTSAEGTDDQIVCENSPIDDISYSAGSGLEGPEVYDLPDGLDYDWNGVTLRIFGTPTESGTFEYTVRTTGACAEITKTGTITIQSSPDAGEISGDQTICGGDDPVAFTSTSSGSSPGAGISYRWESSVSPFEVWESIDDAFGSIYDAPIGLTETTKYRRITLAESNGLICESLPETSPTVTVTVQTPPTPGAIAGEQAICEDGDPVAFISIEAGTGDGVISYLWQLKTDESDWTTISGETGATYDVPAGLNVTTQYRRITVSTLNGKDCLSEPTIPIQVTVQSVPDAGEIAGEQTVCTDGGPIVITSQIDGTGTGTILYRWESNTNLGTSNWTEIPGETGASLNIPAGPTVTTQYRRFAISDVNGQRCESNEATATVTITVQSVPTAGAIAGAQDVCSGDIPDTIINTTAGTGDGAITYRWESSVSPFTDWTAIPDAIDEFYNAATGVTVTTQYRRRTVSTLNGAACLSDPTASVQVTISPDNTVTTAPSQTQCVGNEITSITHTTTGATGIVPESASVRYNLPNGVTASWAEGVITISGTPTESGVFDYNIPLAGGCGIVSATGTINITDPQYPISRIDVINPQVGDPTPATSRFTVYSAELTPGSYTVVYSTSGVNQGLDRTITVNVTTPGQFTFTSVPYTLAGTTELTILSIRKSTDLCPYVPPYQNTALYGIGCSEAFLKEHNDDAFYVPSNVYQVTIQVFGDGMGGNTVSKTIPVWPSGVIYVVFDGSDVFATEVPESEPISVRKAGAIAITTGPNGRIVFSFDCNPIDSCGTIVDNGNQYTDSNGYTVIRFDFEGSCVWQAPDGLSEFEVLVVGGGGGGGFGTAAGGGGGGEVVYRQYQNIRTGEEFGLQGASFNITVGARGAAALSAVQAGGSGGNSSFSGPSFTHQGGTFLPLSAAGGGGGGSSSASAPIRQGGNGASGGGGAASGMDQSAGGTGSAGTGGGGGYGESNGTGGGGGGGAAGAGENANASAGTMNGGNGGSGQPEDISDENVYYGAGGGGTSSGAIINQAGAGGSPYSTNGIDYVAGGGGTNNGLGQPATTYGSGGGAGSTGGSPGFPGVIYIRYPNYSILPVEYLHFDAKYNPTSRSGDLTWTTAKEWENERFDVERSVNTVKDWETIGQVKGAGYSDSPIDYAFQDFNLPLSGGNIFYRLKQRSFNGDSSYSDTKAIRVEPMRGTSYWKVYPNPTTGDPINLELINSGIYHDEVVTVRIIAATGQYDVVESIAGNSLNALVSERLRIKAAGLYTLEISWGIYREYHKVILRR